MIPDFRYAVRQPVKTIPPNCRHVNDSADVFLNGLLKHVCQNRLFVDIWQTAISGTAAVINSHISVENTYIVINLLAAGERINLCCLAETPSCELFIHCHRVLCAGYVINENQTNSIDHSR